MKHLKLTITILSISVLIACAPQPNSSEPILNGSTAAVSPTTSKPIQTSANNADEETKIRDLVTDFGKRLQNVSLLAPDASQEIQGQYSEFVSPALLETWMNDVLEAPGRMVSSPWPDHIEITALAKETSDQYEITGYVVEVTSVEVANGGAADKIPVHMIVRNEQGHWFITEFGEEQ